MSDKKKDLTIDEYKETLIDDIEDEEEIIEEKASKIKKQPQTRNTKKKSTSQRKKKSKENGVNPNLTRRIINIVFAILIVIMGIIAIDVISVARYDKGPYFVINTETYKDGGTKVYYGLGYKVIKYNQIQGRRDMTIGSWSLKYATEPTDISALDLALEFTNKPKDTYKKYYKQFLRVNGDYISKDEEQNTLTFGYKDEGGKYALNIVCSMAEKDSLTGIMADQKEVTAIGTVTNYDLKEDGTEKTLYISNCFAE